VKLSGRQTMGVRLMNLEPGDSVVGIARNAESLEEAADETSDEPGSEDNEMAGGDVS
jgi:DNA gyrase subunit A